jgi:hypothetical protein
MPIVKPNTHRIKDGVKMGAVGMRRSFVKYFEDVVKAEERHEFDGHLPPKGHANRFHWSKDGFIAIDGPRDGVYKAYVQREAGREGIATGTKEVQRVYRFETPDNPVDFLKNIVDRPEGIWIEAHGWA